MPERRIFDDVTNAERARANSTGGVVANHVDDRMVLHSAEQYVGLIKSTRRRTVHFLLPGSQTPISTRSETGIEDTEMGEAVVQGCEASNEKGQFSNGPRDVVNPIHQTMQSMSTIGILDGSSDENSSFASPASPGHGIEDNMLIESTGDDITRVRESALGVFQPAAGTNEKDTYLPLSFDGKESITETSEPANEHWEMSPLVEASTENVSQFKNATIELERLVDVAMDVEFLHPVASPMSVGTNEDGPAATSRSKVCDLDGRSELPGDTGGRTSFFDMVLGDVHTQSQPEQHNTDSMLAGSSHELPTYQELPPQLPYVDDAPWTRLSKRPLEDQEISPVKRQRMDVAFESDPRQSARSGYSSNEATSRPEKKLTSAGEGSKAEPEHPPKAAAPSSVPTPTNWSSFTVANLRKELSKRRLSTRGVKAILVQRLTDYEMTQPIQASLEEQNGHPMLGASEIESAAKGKGKGPEQTGQATVDVVARVTNETIEAASRDEVVEEFVRNLVDDVIAKDLVKSADLLGGGDYSGPAQTEPCVDVEMQDDLSWQDDTHEEVVLLTTSHLNSPVAKKQEQPEVDADVSLESVEAPAIESDIHKGTPPRCSGSGTMWIAKKAQRS